MNEIERRTIDELVTRYILEPELRDIYVEGPSDKILFKWFLNKNECNNIEIYEINSIDINDDLINTLGLQSGNRDRLVALSVELERFLPTSIKYVLCIADSDFDFLLGRKYGSRYLLYTDYTSIEIYFCYEQIIEKILLFGAHRDTIDIPAFMENLTEILQELFIIRSTNEKLVWGLTWVDFIRNCKIKNGLIEFDVRKFIEKYLSKNNKLDRINEFIETCEELKKVKVETHKHQIHGEDYLELLGWYISKLVHNGGHNYRNKQIMRTIIFQSANVRELTNEKMFEKLAGIYKN